jgi:hypothetical protein
VAELTPLTEEVANHWNQEVEAHRHANEAEKMFSDLLVRLRRDDVEAA